MNHYKTGNAYFIWPLHFPDDTVNFVELENPH